MLDKQRVAKARILKDTANVFASCETAEEVAKFFETIAQKIKRQGENRVKALNGVFVEVVEKE